MIIDINSINYYIQKMITNSISNYSDTDGDIIEYKNKQKCVYTYKNGEIIKFKIYYINYSGNEELRSIIEYTDLQITNVELYNNGVLEFFHTTNAIPIYKEKKIDGFLKHFGALTLCVIGCGIISALLDKNTK